MRLAAALSLGVLALGVLTAAYVPGEPAPRANILINPTAEIDQAHEGTSVSLTSGTAAYIVDGIKVQFVSAGHSPNATLSCQRASDAPTGYAYSLKCTVGTAASAVGNGDYIVVLVPIEADNLQDALLGTANAQSLCLQWQSKVSIGGYVVGWAFENFAQTRAYPNTVAAVAAATWTPQQVCFPGDTAGTWVTSGNAGAAYLVLTFAAGSTFQGTAANWAASNVFTTSSQTNTLLTTASSTFQVTNLKLEVSPAPTPFGRLPFQQEIARVQRYYEKSYDIGTALATATKNGAVMFDTGTYNATAGAWQGSGGSIPFKVSKRAAPTMSYWDMAGNASRLSAWFQGSQTDNITPSLTLNAGMNGVMVQGSAAEIIPGGTPTVGHFVADSRL